MIITKSLDVRLLHARKQRLKRYRNCRLPADTTSADTPECHAVIDRRLIVATPDPWRRTADCSTPEIVDSWQLDDTLVLQPASINIWTLSLCTQLQFCVTGASWFYNAFSGCSNIPCNLGSYGACINKKWHGKPSEIIIKLLWSFFWLILTLWFSGVKNRSNFLNIRESKNHFRRPPCLGNSDK